VTGAGGFIGARLVSRLTSAGAEVLALGRSLGRLEEVEHPRLFSFVQSGLDDAAELIDLVETFAPEVVYHLASTPDGRESFQQVRASIEGNLVPTLNLLEAVRAAGGGLFVYADSSKVYGDADVPFRPDQRADPLSSYAIAKAAGWDFCRYYARLHGLDVVSVRPTLIYGPGQGINLLQYVIECVLEGKAKVRLDGGDQTRDPLFLEDAVDAYLAVARHPAPVSGQVVNIGGGRECSVAELARMIVKMMGADLPVEAVEARKRPTETRRSYCDNAEAIQRLGWRPRTDLEAGLRRTITWAAERWHSRAAVAAP
jgi:nucleoside-diphosphate-sugar epimerase